MNNSNLSITYTAPNRAHHYPCASMLYQMGVLHKFVTGFPRISPRSELPIPKEHLHRCDFWQTLYVLSLRSKLSLPLSRTLESVAHSALDRASRRHAINSDVFVCYRATGLATIKKLKKLHVKTLTVTEEVNSHVENCYTILEQEFASIYTKGRYTPSIDHRKRLETYEMADRILCPSEFVRSSFLKKGFDPGKLIKVNFGFPAFSPAIKESGSARSDDGVFRLLYVGQVNFRKGLRYAIEAFRRIPIKNKEFRIVGPHVSPTGIEDLQIPDKVVLTGSLKGQKLIEEYQKATVFILPTLEEGLALVLGEALAFGLPVITTYNSGGADIIQDGVEGFLVEPRDVEALLEKLELLASDDALRMCMSERSRIRGEQSWTWEDATTQMILEFRSALSKVDA